MKLFRLFSAVPLLMSLLCQDSCFAQSQDSLKTVEISEDCLLVADNISEKSSSDSYLEAYIQGVIDTKYPDSGLLVSVRKGDVFLTNLPSDSSRAEEIIGFVSSITNRSVKETRVPVKPISEEKRIEKAPGHEWHGVWLPQSTILFPTQIANPRQICFSGGLRFRDKVAGHIATEVTFGDQFPMYRWANFKGGDLQLELEGGVYGIFDMREQTFPLINTDYYAGIPLTFAKGPWSYRLRLYHISCHVGDEFLEKHHHFDRKNKSFEAVDVSADYQFYPNFRVYGVLGSVIHSDKEMSMKYGYVEYGFEVRGPRKDFEQLFGQPFLAVHLQNWQENNFAVDSTYALGYEWGKIHGIGRKVRMFLEYHNGFSPDGQFSRIRTNFFSIRLAYGF